MSPNIRHYIMLLFYETLFSIRFSDIDDQLNIPGHLISKVMHLTILIIKSDPLMIVFMSQFIYHELT